MRAHPDHGGSSEQFQQVRAAYLNLSDEEVTAHKHPHPQPASTEHLLEIRVTPAMARVGAIVRVPLPRWADCETCGAVGVAHKRRRTCTRCDGTGHVSETVHAHPFVLPCPTCDGTGFTGTPCSACIRGQRLVSMQRKVRLPAGTKTGQVFRIDGRAAFIVKIVQSGP